MLLQRPIYTNKTQKHWSIMDLFCSIPSHSCSYQPLRESVQPNFVQNFSENWFSYGWLTLKSWKVRLLHRFFRRIITEENGARHQNVCQHRQHQQDISNGEEYQRWSTCIRCECNRHNLNDCRENATKCLPRYNGRNIFRRKLTGYTYGIMKQNQCYVIFNIIINQESGTNRRGHRIKWLFQYSWWPRKEWWYQKIDLAMNPCSHWSAPCCRRKILESQSSNRTFANAAGICGHTLHSKSGTLCWEWMPKSWDPMWMWLELVWYPYCCL